MGNKNDLYSFDKRLFDLWHFKITDKMIHKEDYETMEWFSKNINVPFRIYEDHLQAINYEERVHMVFITDNMDGFIKLENWPEKKWWDKLFFGNPEDLKPEIEQYVLENNLGHMRRKVQIKDSSNERVMFSGAVIEFFDHTNSLGFNYKREGLLRFNTKSDFHSRENDYRLYGKPSDFKRLKKYLDTGYSELVYGKEGRKIMENYYQTHFLDTFEYGKSFICHTWNR